MSEGAYNTWETPEGKYSLAVVSDQIRVVADSDQSGLTITVKSGSHSYKHTFPGVMAAHARETIICDKAAKMLDAFSPPTAVATKARRLLAQIVKEHTS
jgi:hypothetical protein